MRVLYARDIKQNILVWSIWLEDSKDGCRIASSAGQLLGLQTLHTSPIIEGTNVGKRNATTSYQQASKELDATYERKRKKGYKSLVDLNIYQDLILNALHKELDTKLPRYNTDANECVKPMKCQPFQLGKFKYPCIGQPKINGVRGVVMLTITTNGMFTEKEVVIKTKEGLLYRIKHICDWFATNVYNQPENELLVFDGEVYCASEHVTSIGGAARNHNNPLHKKLQFICFDLSIPNVEQRDRSLQLEAICIKANGIQQSVPGYHYHLVDHPVVFLCNEHITNDFQAQEYAKMCIGLGYEGAVIRDRKAEYKFGQRPITMMKIKQFSIELFTIIDIIPFNDDTEDTYAMVGQGCKFILLNNDNTNESFTCNPKGTFAVRMEYLENKDDYIGRKAQVKFAERTINNLPFHANVIKVI